MSHQIHYLGYLAYIDERLDELMEDYGDLPDQVKERQSKVNENTRLVNDTERIIDEISTFCANAKITLVDLKDKEEKLAKQQFEIKNNKQFDAITKEIEYIKTEHTKLSDKLRQEGVKLQNLNRILDQQKRELDESQSKLDEKNREVELITGDQNTELIELRNKREKIIELIKKEYYEIYERVREVFNDAAVKIHKNSCAGNIVPSQKIVEVRNNLNMVFTDEHSGRILIPEEFEVDEDFLAKL